MKLGIDGPTLTVTVCNGLMPFALLHVSEYVFGVIRLPVDSDPPVTLFDPVQLPDAVQEPVATSEGTTSHRSIVLRL